MINYKRHKTLRAFSFFIALTLVFQCFIGAAPIDGSDSETDILSEAESEETISEPEDESSSVQDTRAAVVNAEYRDTNGQVVASGSFEEMWIMASQNNGGRVHLTDDIIADPNTGLGSDLSAFQEGGLLIKKNQTISLDLRGHTIDLSNVTNPNFRFATINDPTARLNLYDYEDTTKGTITGYNNPKLSMIHNQGQLNLQNIVIQGNTAKKGIIHTIGPSSKIDACKLRQASIINNTCPNGAIIAESCVSLELEAIIKNNVGTGILLKHTNNSKINAWNNMTNTSYVEVDTETGGLLIGKTWGTYSRQDNYLKPTRPGYKIQRTSTGHLLYYYDASNDEAQKECEYKSNYLILPLKTTFADAWNIANQETASNKTIKLLKDITAKQDGAAIQPSFGDGPFIDGGHVLTVNPTSEIILDLNNFALDKNNAQNTSNDPMGMIFNVLEQARITLKNGTIKNGSGTVAGAIYNSGTTILENITLKNNKATTGGTVTNNQNGMLRLNNSTIESNSNTNPRGGSAIVNKGRCYMFTGRNTITKNANGGIYNTGMLDVGGSPNITGNKNANGEEFNVDTDDGTFTITGQLSGTTTKIGITTQKDTIGTTDYASNAAYFKIDNQTKKVVYDPATKTLKLTDYAPGETPEPGVTPEPGQTPEPDTPPENSEALLLSETGETLAHGTLKDMVNLANTTSYTKPTIRLQKDTELANYIINCTNNSYSIDLNGHNIAFKNASSSDSSVLIDNQSLTITDSMRPVITSKQIDEINDEITDDSKYNQWAQSKPIWSSNKKLKYYTVEIEYGEPVRMQYDVDFSNCGSITETLNSKTLFQVQNSGSLTINGGRYSNSSTVFDITDTAKEAAIENAWLIKSKIAMTTRAKTNIKNSFVIGNESVDADQHTILSGARADLQIENTVIAGNHNHHSQPVSIRSKALIKNSLITANSCNQKNGGAIHIMPSNAETVELNNAVISGNFAWYTNGGAIFVENNGVNVKAINCRFMANRALKGGAWYQETTSMSSPNTLTGCEFAYNYAQSDGGGMYIKTSPINLTNCNIHHNKGNISRGGLVLFQINRTSTIQETTIKENAGADATGGMFIYQSSPVFIKKSKILNNKITKDVETDKQNVGIGIWADASTIVISDTDISGNGGNGGNGGGMLILNNSNVTLSNSNITKNISGYGAGIYTDNTSSLNMHGTMIVDQNTKPDNTAPCNVTTEQGNPIHITKALSHDSKIGVTTTAIPTAQIKIVVADGPYATQMENCFVADDSTHTIEEENGKIVIAINDGEEEEDIAFEGVLVQYYINLRTPVVYDPDAPSLKIIDMDKDNMPKNGQAIEPAFVYIDEATGRIKMRVVLTEMYRPKAFDLNRCTSVNVINRFTDLDRLGWDLTEIWVKKDEAKQNSKNRAEWNIYDYTEHFDIKTLNLQEQSVIRLVCNPKESEKNLETTFFDYDITDGYLYNTSTDAASQTNRQPISSMSPTKEQWFNVNNQGINRNDNITGQTGRAKLIFGNANHLVPNQHDTLSSGWPINKFSRIGTAPNNRDNFEGCVFGLIQGVDPNGKLIWNPEVKAPNLFDDKPAVGKTKLDQYSLNFYRNGSTYTLQRVNGAGTVAQDLITMKHPVYNGKPYTNIWTNDFWPLDQAPHVSQDGHDPMEGGYEYRPQWSIGIRPHNIWSTIGQGTVPQSDNGEQHNPFFGMHTDIKFKLTEDYSAPLHYYFFGDDDLWIFLDGRLICDIGGVHRSVGAYIDLRDYIKVGDADEHTMSIYYTERGASGSTCWMQFTLPANVTDSQHDTHSFKKIDGLGHEVQGAVFSLYSDPECTNELSNHVSGLTGSVDVTNLTATETYYLKESSAPEGYEKTDTIWVLKKENGTWTMSDINDTTKKNVTEVVNLPEDNSGPVLPDTGGTGPMPYILTGISCIGLIVLIIGTTRFTKRRRTKQNKL